MTQIKAIISNIANKKRTVLTIQETKLLGREELAIEKIQKSQRARAPIYLVFRIIALDFFHSLLDLTHRSHCWKADDGLQKKQLPPVQ